MHHRLHLPEAEVPGEEEHALALRVGGAHAFLAVDVDPRPHRLGRQPSEPQQLEQQHAEVLEHPARDVPALGLGARRETLREVGERDAAMRAVEQIEGAPERGADAAHEHDGSSGHGADDAHGGQFERLRCAFTRGLRAPGGSRAVTTSQRGRSSVSGQRATGTGSGPSGSRRTASLSVVATPQAPAAATRRATADRSAGVYQW